MRRYPTEHNDRWHGFEHREGDVVISTRSKCATTWMQMIVALLVHGSDLPEPLSQLSPWLDWDIEPIDVVHDRLDAQTHRRVIKTHTPLDGLPLDDRVTYIVIGRRPLDVAMSLHHHSRNIDRRRFAELAGRPVGRSPSEPFQEWVEGWMADDWVSTGRLDSLSGLVHHVDDAMQRLPSGQVLLVHFDDLVDDLEGRMRWIADRSGIEVDPAAWSSLVVGAGFEQMRADPARAVPDRLGVLIDHAAFFRSGGVGDGAAAVSAEQRRTYGRRLDALARPDVASWLDPSTEPARQALAPPSMTNATPLTLAASDDAR